MKKKKDSLEKGKKLNQRTNNNVNEVSMIANNSFSLLTTHLVIKHKGNISNGCDSKL